MSQETLASLERPLRVLVVDDHRDTLAMLEALLGSLGWDVSVASSSVSALEQVDAASIDLILSDIGLPGMDGYTLIGAIRERSERHIAAIAVTGSGQREDVRRALEAGFDYHITKPITLASLSKAIRHVLGE
jgi:two-component system CheB/CheR fusion protein